MPEIENGCHVTWDACPCGWSGMHWHWGTRVFHSLRDLTCDERQLFDRELLEVDA